jgi:hypothetical protein
MLYGASRGHDVIKQSDMFGYGAIDQIAVLRVFQSLLSSQ